MRARGWTAGAVLLSCVATCDRCRVWPAPLPGDGLSVHGPRVALYFCGSIERECEARAWFADGRDCLDFEQLAWSECELDGGFMACRENPRLDDVLKSQTRTRCSYREIEWADVIDGGYRTPGGQCVR